MLLMIELLGAVALLLWGLRMVRTGVLRSYGPVLRKAARDTEGRLATPVIVGLIMAALLQSSAAASLIVAGFSAQGVVNTATAFLAILGADIGTALATIVISQKLPVVSPLLIATGVFWFLSTEVAKRRGLSRAVTGLGLILLALSLIGTFAGNLSLEPGFDAIMAALSGFPLFMVAGGLVLSYLAHSSLAVVLSGTGLAAAGAVDPIAVVYLVFGANIGSGLLPLMSNINGSKGARVPVTANFLLRTLVAVLACIVFSRINQDLGFANTYYFLPLPLAAHLALNLVVAVVGIAIRRPLLSFVAARIQEDVVDPNVIEPKYLDDALASRPKEALAAAKREALVMSETVQRMVAYMLPLFREEGDSLESEIATLEESVDRLFNAIKSYLADVMQSPLSKSESRQAMDLLSFVTNMEHVGDIVDRNLVGLSAKKRGLHVQFSEAGMAEIEALYHAVMDNFDLAMRAFLSDEAELAKQLVETKSDIRDLEISSIKTHVERLRSGFEDSIQTSELHLDILRDLKRINSHLTSTAYPVLTASGEVPRTKWKRVRKN